MMCLELRKARRHVEAALVNTLSGCLYTIADPWNNICEEHTGKIWEGGELIKELHTRAKDDPRAPMLQAILRPLLECAFTHGIIEKIEDEDGIDLGEIHLNFGPAIKQWNTLQTFVPDSFKGDKLLQVLVGPFCLDEDEA